ncbi:MULTISPECIES: hypothetical protein [unclassified Sphingomonas]|uniref:hypothetical protein n=1 Tax=unclassified Sphingomonas TaxID=196159 RepID=UPI00226ADB95|nr:MULTISPECIES: hypothetical protein [unclassified Sphingomonas]
MIFDPRSGRWTAASVKSNLLSAIRGVEMSNTALSDHRLLNEAKAALRGKDGERAKALFDKISERSVARSKAKVANDPA